MIADAKTVFKLAEKDRREITDPINESVKKINDKYRPVKDLAKEIEAVGKDKVHTYLQRVRKEQAEAERKARERAEKERLRKEELARKAMDRGDHKKAQEHLRKADEVQAEKVETEATTATGSHTVTTWKAEVTDFESLVLAVADTIVAKRRGDDHLGIPTEALLPNETYLRKTASAVKNLVKWPGVRFYSEESLSVRTKK